MSDEQDHAGDDDWLRDRLRAGDPAASLPPVGSDRVRRLLEETMAHDHRTDPATPGSSAPGWRRRWPVAVAAAAVLVLGGVAAGIALGGDDDPGALSASDEASTDAPSAPASEDPGAAGAESDDLTALSLTAAAPPPNLRCRMVTAEALGSLETAFAGTVTAVADETVTFEVDRWFAGGDVDVVEVLNPPGLGAALEGPPPLEPGQRFLITAAGGQVTGCGFSAPYSERLERMFEQAF